MSFQIVSMHQFELEFYLQERSRLFKKKQEQKQQQEISFHVCFGKLHLTLSGEKIMCKQDFVA